MDCDDPFVIKVDIKHQQMAPQLFDANLNPWDVSSLYDFQYFCCPQCVYEYEYERITDAFGEQIADLIDENAEDPFDPFQSYES